LLIAAILHAQPEIVESAANRRPIRVQSCA
jgi:hypothetical protein